MARRRNKHQRAPRPLPTGRGVTRRTVRGRSFLVRQIPAGRSEKEYRCPGCNHAVRPGVAHVVAWPETPALGDESGLESRRHWHTFCWERT